MDDYELTRQRKPGYEYQYYGWYDNRPITKDNVSEAFIGVFIKFPLVILLTLFAIVLIVQVPVLGLLLAYWLLHG